MSPPTRHHDTAAGHFPSFSFHCRSKSTDEQGELVVVDLRGAVALAAAADFGAADVLDGQLGEELAGAVERPGRGVERVPYRVGSRGRLSANGRDDASGAVARPARAKTGPAAFG